MEQKIVNMKNKLSFISFECNITEDLIVASIHTSDN